MPREDRISEVLEEMVGHPVTAKTLLGGLPSPPKRSTLHSNKEELKQDQKALKKLIGAAQSLNAALAQISPSQRARIDSAARRRASMDADLPARYYGTIHSLTETIENLAEFLSAGTSVEQENLASEAEFWNRKLGRPENHHAYKVALWLARFYWKETGKLPTYGTNYSLPQRLTRAHSNRYSTSTE